MEKGGGEGDEGHARSISGQIGIGKGPKGLGRPLARETREREVAELTAGEVTGRVQGVGRPPPPRVAWQRIVPTSN